MRTIICLHLIRIFLGILAVGITGTRISGQDLSQLGFYGFPGKGIPTYGINVVFQDHEHFIWIGSSEGLFRFDGQETKQIIIDPDVQVIREIYDIAGHPDSSYFWLCAEDFTGKFSTEQKTFTSFSKDANLPGNGEDCTMICIGKSGSVWTCCGSHIYRLAPAIKEIRIPREVISGGNSIFDIVEDEAPPHQVYLATYQGVWRCNTVNEEFVKVSPISATSILSMGKNAMLTGNTWEDGIHYLDLNTREYSELLDAHGKRLPAVKTIVPFGDDTWIAVTNNRIIGLSGFVPFVHSQYEIDPRLRYFSNGWIDAEERIWTITASGLMTAPLHTGVVQNYLLPVTGYSPDNLTNVIERSEDVLIQFSDSRNLYVWDKNKKAFSGIINVTGSSRMIALSTDDQLTVMPDHLLIIRGSESELWYPTELKSVPGLEYSAILQQDSATYWIGSRWHGVYKLNTSDGSWVNFNEVLQGRLGSGNNLEIRKLFKDRNRNIWVGSRDGFSVWENALQKFYTFPYSAEDSLSVKSAKAFVQDYRGVVWIADGASGLYALNPLNLEAGIIGHMSLVHGLKDERIWAMASDSKGVIWMATQSGLQSWNPLTGQVTLFGEADGILVWDYERNLPNLFPGYLQQLNDGRMLLGYRHGFGVFRPEDLLKQQRKMEIYFTSVYDVLRNKPLMGIRKTNSALNLKYNQNSLRIDFSAIDYSNASALAFSYLMEGIEDHWVQTAQHSVTYGHLDPGNYRFRLRPVNTGSLAQQEIQLTITLPPPWWHKWWMYALYVVLFTTIVIVLYRAWLQRKLAEREAAQLREIDRMKSDLYQEIAHEFRTPLTLAMSLIDRVTESNGTMETTELEQVQHNVQKLVDLADAVRDLSDLESGKVYVSSDQFDLVPFLKYLAQSYLIQAESQEKMIACNMDFARCFVRTDRNKLQTILENLISNAIKFTTRQGRIMIKASAMDDRLQISVEDNGIGIKGTDLHKVFDRFYRVSSQIPGQGIGLTLAQRLAHLIGGTLTVKSEPGIGSVFMLLLPGSVMIAETVEENSDLQIASWEPLLETGIHVLVIEDQADMAAYIGSLLNYVGKISYAGDAAQARERAYTTTPDLIVSDVMLPDGNGIDLCHELKTDLRTSHIPVVIVTGKGNAQNRIKAMESGVDAFLSKPFHAEELHAVVQQIITNRKALQSYYQHLFSGGQGLNIFPDISSAEDPWVEELRQYVMAHLTDITLDVRKVCLEFGISKSNLHRKLIALTGQSLLDIIHQLRLNRAKEMLEGTDTRITDIAYDCGFSDPGYFARLFKKYTGKSPSAFRSLSR